MNESIRGLPNPIFTGEDEGSERMVNEGGPATPEPEDEELLAALDETLARVVRTIRAYERIFG